MSIFEYNGSALVAMVGKNCFAIASDRRLGVQLQTVATDFQKIFKIHDKLYIGLSGLATDVQTLYQRLVFRHKLYQLREERDMKPETFASLVSAILYEKRLGIYRLEFPSSFDLLREICDLLSRLFGFGISVEGVCCVANGRMKFWGLLMVAAACEMNGSSLEV